MSTEQDHKQDTAESWDECAATWNDDEIVNMYCRKAYESLSSAVQLDNIKTILDFGCGTGLLTERLLGEGVKIVALDISEKMIEVLNEKQLPNVVTVTEPLSVESIGANSHLQNKFDLIVASSVCSFLSNYDETLTLIKSMLSPTGVFVQWDWLLTNKNVSFGFSMEQVESALKRAGFSSVDTSVGFSFADGEMGVFEHVLMGVGRG